MIEMFLPQNTISEPPIPVIGGVYKQLASAVTPRSSHSVVAIDGKIYAFGGSYGALNSTMEVYDIETNTWAPVVAQGMPSPRHGCACCVLNGKFYIFGGSTGNGWGPMSQEVYVFDPATVAWTKLANTPNAVALHTAVPIKGKIYIFAGFNGGAPVNDLYEYDPVANTYRTIANSQPVQHGHKAVAIGDRMFVVGGVSSSTLLNRCVAYDPVNNTWQHYAASPVGNTYTFVGALGNYIYMFGGSLNNITTTNNRLFKFSLETNSWAELPSGASPAYLGWMAVSDKALYLHGGYNNTAVLAELWEVK
jgi:N-acetylneuraminic acid mutarotase